METSLFGGKRLKLGIWGLGRGGNFIRIANSIGIDVVAGCDLAEDSRKDFIKACPEAFVTADEDEFLKAEMDAVLVATFCPAHAAHAIKALKAGKHVLSEVTSFFTPAEGVALVEAVEQSGLVYNLAENYPFSKSNMYLAKLYREGLFGELAYAEFDYVHGGSNPAVSLPLNIGPIKPGNQLHSWRGYLNYHYYCTHSRLRPEKVVAFPDDVSCPGCVHGKGRKVDGIMPNLSAFAPSLIYMSNGGVVRNLMGGSSANSFQRRFFGTKAAAFGDKLVLGGAGRYNVELDLEPKWEMLEKEAEAAGHDGGDFWILYYFARQILTGEKAPWDIYAASDVTLAGIQAIRSAVNEGMPMEVPDFRKPEVRERYRHDNWFAPHIEPKKIFPDNQDIAITDDFTSVIYSVAPLISLVRIALDGMKAYPFVTRAQRITVLEKVKELRSRLPEIAEHYRRMRRIADAYPDSQGGQALLEKLELGEEARIMQAEALQKQLDDFLLNA